jgi:glycosyltransferase involved in cell wall biosynthesis
VPADAPTALYYGRLTEAKGLHIALDAWQRLGPSHCDAHLLLAGDLEAGTDPGLAAMVTTLGRTGAATVLPSQRHVAPLLHAADVVLFPTLAQEAFGRVALEALVTGRPVIASDIGGVPEILAGPLAELLVPPGDADALATTLASLLRWREERPGLGTLCRTEAESRFSFDRHVDTVATALERAASGRRSHARS